MRLGVFGGTFNPIHFGHLRTAEEVRHKLNLDTIIFVPSGNPPLKSLDVPDARHRYAMAQLATASNANFTVSDVELQQKEKSYTVNTLRKLHETYPQDELFFILGADAFLDIPNWWQPDKLTGMADFIVVTRPGLDSKEISRSPYIAHGCNGPERAGGGDMSQDAKGPVSFTRNDRKQCFVLESGRTVVFVPVTPLDISSTDIRILVKEHKSIRYLLPENVEEYICQHRLYR